MTYVKNAILGVLAIALIAGVGASPVVAQLNAGTSASVTFTRNLTVGSTGADVLALQQWLNKNGCPIAATGAGSVGMESTYFGAKTKAAVACWQAAHNISPAVGYFGPTTRAAVNAMVVVTPPVVTPPVVTPPTGLSGGAGSVDNYTLVSSLSSEEVGEDANDVKVAGLEVENSDGSDLQFTALRLVFNEGTANQDFNDYADEVAIWLGSNEVARADASDFTDNNDWSQTVSLDSDAIIRAGDTGTFYVTVSGASNLDTNDIGDTWTLDFTSARFRDAQAATISEDPTVVVTTFSFESFAASADTTFKITDGLDSVNDAHVINIATSSDDTNDVAILSFNVEIEGDSDVNLDAFTVTTTVTGTSNVDDMLAGLSLWMDGEEVGTANISTDCVVDADCVGVGTEDGYLFDNLDLDLTAGSDYDFLVKADIKSTSDAGVTDGDTISAAFGETQTNNASFKAEDESGEDLVDADITGSVTSEASEVRDIGIMVTLVSVESVKTSLRDPGVISTNDQGTFTITFDVTAFDGDAYIDHTAPARSGGVTESDLGITGGLSNLLASSVTSPSGATDGAEGFRVREDQTERFAITAVLESATITPTTSAFYQVSLDNLRYALSDVEGDISYTSNLTDFKAGPLFLSRGQGVPGDEP
jgi:hypothetical protein